MTTRRDFIIWVPLSGTALLAACSDKAPAPAPAPVPEPAPAPVAEPAPAPAPEPAAAPEAAAPAPTTAEGPLPMLDEQDPTAQALGYVADASRVDTARFRNFQAGQACSNCTLYTAAAGAAAGPCTIFPGKWVAGPGWCSAYVRRTG